MGTGDPEGEGTGAEQEYEKGAVHKKPEAGTEPEPKVQPGPKAAAQPKPKAELKPNAEVTPIQRQVPLTIPMHVLPGIDTDSGIIATV